MSRRSVQVVLLLILWAMVALPNLGSTGLSDSEGHRVVPAVEMLETGEYLVPQMFGQAYVRKPQGVVWLFALALSVHDDVELSPRLVSAGAFGLMGLGAWFFGRRWFGGGAGFVAGVATILTPLFWSPARSAEIESVHNLMTALGAWVAIELLVGGGKGRGRFVWCFALGLLAFGMLVVKGPAGFPALGGVLVAGAVLGRSLRPIVCLRVWVPVLIAGGVFAWHWSNTLVAAGGGAVVQSPDAFMFEAGQVVKLMGFVPVSLLTALPVTLVLLFPWGADAKAEALESEEAGRRLEIARLIGLGCVCGLLLMMVAGVSNDRYAQPVLGMLGPLVGWGLCVEMGAHRARILRVMMFGSARVMCVVLCVLAVVYVGFVEPVKRGSSGKVPGEVLAGDFVEVLPAGRYVVVADAMIEARPEVLLYLRRSLKDTQHQVSVCWVPGLDLAQDQFISTLKDTDLGFSGVQVLALVRSDSGVVELGKGLVGKRIAGGVVHEFAFELVEVVGVVEGP